MPELFEKRLRRRLRAFLNGPKSKSSLRVEPIRKDAVEVLQRATSRHWGTYIVGGAIRDLLLNPTGSWPRDVDVIVDGCSPDELREVFRDIVVRPNSFGGLHLRKTVEIDRVTTTKYDLLFDLWRLEDTWAIKTGKLPATIASFLTTPFLNIDSVAAAVVDRSVTQIHENAFFQAIEKSTLEINNEHNPFPVMCIVRSLLLAAKLDFCIGPHLATFIQTSTRSIPTSHLIEAQVSHYGRIRCFEEHINEWLASVRLQMSEGKQHVRLTNSPDMQLRLWKELPSDRAI